MLARGILCRLAADVPKTSAHNVARISHVLHRAAIARNATSIASPGALLHAYRLAHVTARRSYGTATAKTPANTVKKVTVKKTVTEKPATKKSAAKKKPATKDETAPTKATRAKTAPKKTRSTRAPSDASAAKKAEKAKKAAERAARKATLQAKLKEVDDYKKLEETALKPPKRIPDNAWHVFMAEKMRTEYEGQGAVQTLKPIGAAFKNLSPAEREHYNHLSMQNKATNDAAEKAWILSHTPDQIRAANNARRSLRKRFVKAKEAGLTKSKRRYPVNTILLKDDRLPKPPKNARIHFQLERSQSGDFNGIAFAEVSRLIAAEYKGLSASEKKKYEDLAAESSQQYKKDYNSTFGCDPPGAGPRPHAS